MDILRTHRYFSAVKASFLFVSSQTTVILADVACDTFQHISQKRQLYSVDNPLNYAAPVSITDWKPGVVVVCSLCVTDRKRAKQRDRDAYL